MSTYRAITGRILTETDIDALATEVQTRDYDIEALCKRRRGWPTIGSGPAEVITVRMDPELRTALDARVEADGTTASEIIRTALRAFLGLPVTP